MWPSHARNVEARFSWIDDSSHFLTEIYGNTQLRGRDKHVREWLFSAISFEFVFYATSAKAYRFAKKNFFGFHQSGLFTIEWAAQFIYTKKMFCRLTRFLWQLNPGWSNGELHWMQLCMQYSPVMLPFSLLHCRSNASIQTRLRWITGQIKEKGSHSWDWCEWSRNIVTAVKGLGKPGKMLVDSESVDHVISKFVRTFGFCCERISIIWWLIQKMPYEHFPREENGNLDEIEQKEFAVMMEQIEYLTRSTLWKKNTVYVWKYNFWPITDLILGLLKVNILRITPDDSISIERQTMESCQ